jgi:hypothetical protein
MTLIVTLSLSYRMRLVFKLETCGTNFFIVPIPKFFELSREIPFVPQNPVCPADQKKHIQTSLCERSQYIFPSTPSATPNKKIKLMVEGEVNDATTDEDSDNEQL